MSNDDHSTVIFLMPFFLFMCNVGMCVSFSILLLFLIMASLGIAFQQDGRRQREREQNMACKRRKKDKRAQDLKRIRERRNHLNANVNEDDSINSVNSVLEEEKEEEREFPSSQRTYRQYIVHYNYNLHIHAFFGHCIIHLCLGVFATGLFSLR